MTVHVVGDPTPLYEEKVSQQQQQIDELEKENKRLKLLLLDQNGQGQEHEKLLAENRRLAGSVEELQSRNKALMQANNKLTIGLTQLKQQVLDTNNKLATALTSMKTKAKPKSKRG